ncbi:glycosyltransferase family 4 protein [Photobacterium leiognathi]|uniref:glycosyltransferase family 4 protein n=1 Tax=Photobacterium leiognathi TaxID=553611 RepID=UPI0027356DD0|nr:glycosyltransferase family 1 protein [Photobacterium leiognathi]
MEIRNQHQLVLVGSSGWKNSDIYLKAKDYIDNGQIVIAGYMSDDELKLLYHNCRLFIYPSVYEGFGLPIIEAMASGCVVATSNCGATAEIAGSSAILFDPFDSNSIKKSIFEYLKSNKNMHLTDLARAHAKNFSWKITVDELLNRIQS